ncbi:MAG: RNA polymerase sigma factor [Balneolaceae bacterium]|nr:RNA polymerase sigma factor [Balneolaceae bacterium]MBO6547670.1 RNA polymerase sigma factor [Balneolaceae bacterium]MBO6648181.1 RNA polymerase sigma factor [Balneolaceae bacterium]
MKKEETHILNDYLVVRYQEGDKQALKLLIKQFHPRLEQQIFAQTRDKASLEDLVQESWYAIIAGLTTVTLRINFEVWALSIARRKAIDWIREQQRARKRAQFFVQEEMNAPTEEDALDIILERKAQLKLAIKGLPHSQRIVLTMFYLENYSVQEISDVLRISDGTVKSRLFNAREHLKEIFNPNK